MMKAISRCKTVSTRDTPRLSPTTPRPVSLSRLPSAAKTLTQNSPVGPRPTTRRISIRTTAVGNNGIYPGSGLPWEFPPPKVPAKERFAQWWFLALTEATHYLIFATQLAVVYALWERTAILSPKCASFFWVLMAPTYQALAGFGPVLMHEYEGWQIAPFHLPPVDPLANNNELLRRAAYRVLFMFQAVAALMGVVGVYGLSKWHVFGLTLAAPLPAWIIGLTLLALYAAPRNWLFPMPAWLGPFFKGLLPAPIVVFVLFVVSIIPYTFAQARLIGVGWAVTYSLLNFAGGMVEAIAAEGTFNQFWHWLAVVLLNVGGLLTLYRVTHLYPL
ncbi:hypothetical protein WJX72_003534 [[Myrmecia] bisecta]|uniref:Uncharacterized protein n=1 Tax=[Myrmecia] bisecta TaxID=41462 RepID=A0AAW1P7H9_9CHLO